MSAVQEIWLVGGYGDVGFRTAQSLLQLTDARLVLAGRNADAAVEAASRLGSRVRGQGLDVRQAATAPDTAIAVLNFVDGSPPGLASSIVGRGGLYLDASADPVYLAGLKQAIGPGPGLAVLNAGLTPGITNVLAHEIAGSSGQIRSIDVSIEIGAGRHHGHAATTWILRNVNAPYRAKRDGHWVEVQPARETKTVSFGPHSGPVSAIGFGFADQQAIAESLPLQQVRTFLALDPAYLTRLLGWIARSRMATRVEQNADFLAKVFRRLPAIGGAGTRVRVQGYDADGHEVRAIGFESGDQAEITAATLAFAAAEALRADASGAHNLERILNYQMVKDMLQRTMPHTAWFERQGNQPILQPFAAGL